MALVFSFIVVTGIGAGIYSSTKMDKILKDYSTTAECQHVYMMDMYELNSRHEQGIITGKQLSEMRKQKSLSNQTYLGDNILRSESDMKDDYKLNLGIFVAGLGAIGVGTFGTLIMGNSACKKDDKYQEALEEENKE